MNSAKTLFTADELEQMPDVDSVRRELDEGELIEMPPAGSNHGAIAAMIAHVLIEFAAPNKLGRVYTDSGFRLKGDTVRAPDVAFVAKERAAPTSGYATGAPDLAVEIMSPSDDIRQLMRKVKQYFAAGTHTIWIVYPEKRELQILEATGTDHLLTGGDLLEAPELLPGFSVSISEFFD